MQDAKGLLFNAVVADGGVQHSTDDEQNDGPTYLGKADEEDEEEMMEEVSPLKRVCWRDDGNAGPLDEVEEDRLNTKSSSLSAALDGGVAWQWEHRTGFRSYDVAVMDRIESNYQRGINHVRLKSGKFGATPMELFLLDGIQYDPTTTNTRRIRRIGRDYWWQAVRRKVCAIFQSMQRGNESKQLTFMQYQRRQASNVVGHKKRVRRISTIGEGKMTALISYSLTDGALKDTRWTRLVMSPWFFHMSMVIVILNAIYIGIDADHNKADILTNADVGYQIMENLFCSFFVFELFARTCVYRRWKYCLSDRWWLFDAVLSFLTVLEAWIAPVIDLFMRLDSDGNQTGNSFSVHIKSAAILRTCRLLRLSRLAHMIPEVNTLWRGVSASMRTVVLTVALLLVALYVFGVIFKVQGEQTDVEILREEFATVSTSMWTLLLRCTLLDSPSATLRPLLDESTFMAGLFVFVIFISNCVLMNMLIGILVTVVHGVFQAERERHETNALRRSITELLECFDRNDDGNISKDEFDLVMRNPEMNSILKRHGVDCVDLTSLRDVLFEEKTNADPRAFHRGLSGTSSLTTQQNRVRELSFAEFIEVVVRLRGGNTSTVLDIVDLREYVRQRFDRHERKWLKQCASTNIASRMLNAAGVRDSIGRRVSADQESTTGSRSGKDSGTASAETGSWGVSQAISSAAALDRSHPRIGHEELWASHQAMRKEQEEWQAQMLQRQSAFLEEMREKHEQWHEAVSHRQTAFEQCVLKQQLQLAEQIAALQQLIQGGPNTQADTNEAAGAATHKAKLEEPKVVEHIRIHKRMQPQASGNEADERRLAQPAEEKPKLPLYADDIARVEAACRKAAGSQSAHASSGAEQQSQPSGAPAETLSAAQHELTLQNGSTESLAERRTTLK